VSNKKVSNVHQEFRSPFCSQCYITKISCLLLRKVYFLVWLIIYYFWHSRYSNRSKKKYVKFKIRIIVVVHFGTLQSLPKMINTAVNVWYVKRRMFMHVTNFCSKCTLLRFNVGRPNSSKTRIRAVCVRELLEWICKSFRKHNYWKRPPNTNLIISPAQAKKNKRRPIVHAVRSTEKTMHHHHQIWSNCNNVSGFGCTWWPRSGCTLRLHFHRPHVNKSSPCAHQSRSSPWTVIPPSRPPALPNMKEPPLLAARPVNPTIDQVVSCIHARGASPSRYTGLFP
jgi:hypothetical protein